MSDSFQLKAIITGVDRLSPTLASMSKSMQKNMRGIAQAAQRVGVGLAAAITGSSMAFAQQEDAMMGLKTAMMDSSGNVSDDFKKITDLATGLGNKLPGTTADFADMMQTLVRQGVPAKNILDGVGEATAYMAVQMKEAPKDVADQIAKLQDATKTLSKDMLELADATQRAYYMGVDLADSVAFYGKASPVLGMVSKVGVKSAEIFEPFNVMLNQAGMQGEAAGNAMRKVMGEMMNPKNMRKASRAGGVSLKFTANGEFAGIENMYKQLAKLKPLSTVKRMAALRKGWGDDAETLQALNTIIDKGADGYKEIQQRMAKQASLNKRVEASLGTLSNMWDAMTGTATNAAASIGEVFAPEIKKATGMMSDLTVEFDDWVKANPQTVKTIAAVAGAIAGVGLAIKVVNGALLLMDANPVVAGVLAIAAAAAFLIMNWDDVKKSAKKMWGELKGIVDNIEKAFKGMADHVAGWVKGMIDPVVKAFEEMWDKVKAHTPDFILKFLSNMDASDATVKGVPTPPINPSMTASPPPTFPPMPDYTSRGQQPGTVNVNIDHTNAQPGTRSTVTSSGPVQIKSHKVGYTSFSSQYANEMGGR